MAMAMEKIAPVAGDGLSTATVGGEVKRLRSSISYVTIRPPSMGESHITAGGEHYRINW